MGRNLVPTKAIAKYTCDMLQVVLGEKKYLDYGKKRFEIFPYKKDKLQAKSISFSSKIRMFLNKDECVKYYNDKIYTTIHKFEQQKIEIIELFDNTIETLKESFVESDYLMETLIRGK